MNVLGVTFDSKLNWSTHVANAICKAKKIYYNAGIWLTPELSAVMKQSLLSISANALRSCMMSFNCDVSFETDP